jgi:pathogenesis-related protein 1
MMRIGAATTAALVTLGLGPGVAAAAVAATGSAITAAQRDEIIAQHNLFRAEVGVPPLTWDDTIAAGAQQWADAKEADGRFEHSGTDLGENLAGGGVKDATIRLATGVGVTPPDDERANYQTDPQPAGQEKKQVGHYTQIVWSSTTKVGCGFAPADKLAFGLVVCRYSPPGNFRGQFPYPVGTAVIPQPGLDPVQAAGGGTPQAEASRVEKPQIAQGETTQGETQQGEASPGAVAPTACPDTDVSGLSPSDAAASLTCLITSARTDAGLRDLTASSEVRTVATAIAAGTRPPDVAAALTAAGYCPGAAVASWSDASFTGGSPRAAYDYFATNARAIVLSPGGDLGVGAAGGTFALLLARCN